MKHLIGAAFTIVSLGVQSKTNVSLSVAKPGKTVVKRFPVSPGLVVQQVSSCPKEDAKDEYCSDKIYVIDPKIKFDPKVSSPLISIEHDGHGASGIGEDSVTIDGTLLTHSTSGGAGERWDETSVYQLSPLTLVSTNSTTYYAGDPGRTSSSSTNYLTAKSRLETSIAGECRYGATSIPQVDAPVGMDNLILRGCFATLEDHLRGNDLTDVRVVKIGNELVVDIGDKKLQLEGKSWLSSDHIEVWLGKGESVGISSTCPEGKIRDATIAQWAIDLSRKVSIPAYNDPITELKVTTYSIPTGLRVVITLPSAVALKNKTSFDFNRISVAWSRGNGKSQISLKATSLVHMGEAASLGELQSFNCEINDGALIATGKKP